MLKITVRQKQIIILYLLALLVGVIAGRVEYLNAAARYYLPRTKPSDVGKWCAIFLNEERWRRAYGPRDEAGAPVTRELTPDEQSAMRSDIARENANSRLRDWVATAGLMQYLLLPALVIATLVSFGARPTARRAATLAPVALIIVFAAASLWHRGYFSSLEW